MKITPNIQIKKWDDYKPGDLIEVATELKHSLQYEGGKYLKEGDIVKIHSINYVERTINLGHPQLNWFSFCFKFKR